ncbi:DUF3718 domain-containing protein [Shewanella sp. D64]|uniref:DUF3718 domain-containing protein n=1 Tax=unclassified Shewanella TaxID=196818 RepID=UPI0022BA522A|nr:MULTISPECIES: DUF3718 domain-containing protein [unclassified Shewanella]MEC4727267.1 DUF3718 domain-containing protein [Shewanella sp. D64]MEC4739422.1 DUF3718 domain-containing protein [Shewanella sp. E94]WBJ96751.1 DUF3718 domain-containing protein [Shewanella sp. MTB7]
MRLLPITIAAVIALSSYTLPAHAEYPLASSICQYVQTNDKNRLRKKLKETRIKIRNIYADISCNGYSLLRFAFKSGSDEIGTYIAKRLPVSKLNAAEADGNDISAWVEANGHSDSAINVAIQARISGG